MVSHTIGRCFASNATTPNYNAEKHIKPTGALLRNNTMFLLVSEFLKSSCFWKVATACVCGVWLTQLLVEGSPGGREPGLRTGELAGLQSSGKGFGMAGRDDVFSCCSSSCNLLSNRSTSIEQSVSLAILVCLINWVTWSLRWWPEAALWKFNMGELWNESCWHVKYVQERWLMKHYCAESHLIQL